MSKRWPYVLLTVLLAVPGVSASDVTERFQKTVSLSNGGTFVLENVNGSVHIESWDQPSVEIDAEKRAPSAEEMRDLSIEVTGEGSLVEVRTRYARRNGKGSVSYHVRVPQDARIEAKTVNGKMEITRIEGSIKASTVNGGVRVEDASGDVEASCVNGDVDARYSDVTDGRHRFSTTNGSITVELPSGAGGDFDARTVNGSIRTDFPVTMSGTMSRRHLSGQFGSGGARFEMSTVNGSVSLRNH